MRSSLILLRARRLGLLPWFVLGPSLVLLALIALSTITDLLLPWHEARAAVSARKPSLTICTSLNSRREYEGSTVVSGSLERSYLLFFPRSWPTSLSVRQALPAGTVAVAEGPDGLFLPTAAILGLLVGLILGVARYRRPDVLIPNSGEPPFAVPLTTASATAAGTIVPPLRPSSLYAVGYFVAWFAVLAWFGIFVFTFASLPSDGSVSTLHESPLVAALSAFFGFSLLASWLVSILVWSRVPRRGAGHILAISLLAWLGFFWSFAYLFVSLPLIRLARIPGGP
jgi:hypothetical protein